MGPDQQLAVGLQSRIFEPAPPNNKNNGAIGRKVVIATTPEKRPLTFFYADGIRVVTF